MLNQDQTKPRLLIISLVTIFLSSCNEQTFQPLPGGGDGGAKTTEEQARAIAQVDPISNGDGPTTGDNPGSDHPGASPDPQPSSSSASSSASSPDGNNGSGDNEGSVDGIWFNISEVHISIQNSDGSQEKRVIATSVGMVNLSDLKKDLFGALGVTSLPAAVTLKSISLILYSSGSEVIRDGSWLCDLKVPSAAQSGFKIKVDDLYLQAGFHYTFQLIYDAEGALKIHNGNQCILSPPVSDIESDTE